MERFFCHPRLILALRMLLGGVFLAAGVIKFLDPAAFAQSVTSYRLLSPGMVRAVTVLLPPLEVVLGLMLLLGYRQRLAAWIVGGLCVLFLAALALAAARGLAVDCGCLGRGRASLAHVFLAISRDLGLLAIALWLVTAPGKVVARAS